MSPDDVIRLRHMADATESALRFCQGRTRADLDTDDMLRFALTRAVEIIGEAANKASNETRTQTPGIAWPAIVGMRNRLACIIHEHYEITRQCVSNPSGFVNNPG